MQLVGASSRIWHNPRAFFLVHFSRTIVQAPESEGSWTKKQNLSPLIKKNRQLDAIGLNQFG